MSRTGLIFPLLLSVSLLAAVSACGGDDNNSSSDKGVTTTSRPDPGHGDHTGGHTGDQQYGGVHAPPVVSVRDVAKLGEGPRVGDRWTASIGINVCGRFLDPLPGLANKGLIVQPTGEVEIAPQTEEEAGLSLTLGDYASSVGLKLSTGELGLPAGISPSEIPVGDDNIALGGKTFYDGATCGGTKANVVVWVYPADAVDTGKGLVIVTKNPQDIPFPTDGMAMVITLSPESSLPTLPPSAVVAD